MFFKTDDENRAAMITKTLKKHKKEKIQKDVFCPSCIDLYKWCEMDGMSDFYNMIRNRILKELESDEEDGILGDHVYFQDDLYHLYLDNDGIFLVSHILNGYFGTDRVRYVWLNIRGENQYRKKVYDFKKAVKSATTETLEQILPNYIELEKQHGQNEFSEILKSELDKRKRKIVFSLNKRRSVKNGTTI